MASVHLPRAYAVLECLALDLAEFSDGMRKAQDALLRFESGVICARLDAAEYPHHENKFLGQGG